MSATILAVDDQKDLLELLSMNLGAAGFVVRTAASGAEAMSVIRANRPDLILLDVMLGDISGVQLAAKLKNSPETAGIPIVMLTAKDSETDVVVGLTVGADDYVTKPFSTAVLVARIEAVLRRPDLRGGEISGVLAAGPVRIVPESCEVLVEGQAVELTEGEYNILVALVEAGGKVLARAELKELSGAGKGEKERVVDVHIASLRKKLGAGKDIIKTVHGRGYRLRTQ
ncbi:MAG: response regulator transcription factor [Phycisphaerae bacterium]|nr:response regulator transcription factor [Phycisphaerae bacterium]